MADGLPEQDRPQWRLPSPAGPAWETRSAHGLLDALTWQARRIRLLPHRAQDGTKRVGRVVVCAGDRLAAVRPDFEWHTAWTYTAKPKKGQPRQRPRRHRRSEHAWQGFAALLALGRQQEGEGPRTSGVLRQISDLQDASHLPGDLQLRVRTCSLVYGNQAAVVEDALADTLPLPASALVADSRTRAAILEAARQTAEVAQALDRLSADLRRAEGAKPLPGVSGQQRGAAFLGLVDPSMRRLLRGLQLDAADEDRIEQGMQAWEQVLFQLAWSAAHEPLASASPTTFTGRITDEGSYRAATARSSFTRALNAILPRAAESRGDKSDLQEGEA